MKILICDDEQTYLNTLQIHIEEYMSSHHIPCTVTALTDPTQVAKDTQYLTWRSWTSRCLA